MAVQITHNADTKDGMSLEDLKAFVAETERAGVDTSQPVLVRVSISGKMNKITVGGRL
ncbi:hypothetical protein SEA_JAMUN_26 [Arthrobacter phage Jamun]|nr:hypothetical protein SEA_JAMUN_26 [Arthrobacter phage Jamun]WNM65699.1 hypothetical protein SEA_VULPECULA_26 [Arthrobacter phage Vulpecula]